MNLKRTDFGFDFDWLNEVIYTFSFCCKSILFHLDFDFFSYHNKGYAIQKRLHQDKKSIIFARKQKI
jgi:hypothetical protein